MVMPGHRQRGDLICHHFSQVRSHTLGRHWDATASVPEMLHFRNGRELAHPLECPRKSPVALFAIPNTSASPIPRGSSISLSGCFSIRCHSDAANAAYAFTGGSRKKERRIFGGVRLWEKGRGAPPTPPRRSGS